MRTNKYYLDKIYERHGDTYTYKINENEIIDYASKITIVCKIHGEFIQRIDHHINGSKCPRCAGSYYKTTEEVVKQIKLAHGEKYDCSKVNYINNKTLITLICQIHGEFKVKAATAINKNAKVCLKCIGREVFTTEDFIIKANKIHNNYYDYSKVEYINAKTKVEIICPKHGIFFQTPDQHFNCIGCRRCYIPRNSRSEKEWLDSLNIPDLKRNYHVKINGKKYYFDGYDEKTNTVYEFYGDFYHGNYRYFDSTTINPTVKKYYYELYSETLKREKVIKDAGYNLITIWEADFLKNKGIIKPELDPQKKYWQRVQIMKYWLSRDGDDPVEDYSYILNIP